MRTTRLSEALGWRAACDPLTNRPLTAERPDLATAEYPPAEGAIHGPLLVVTGTTLSESSPLCRQVPAGASRSLVTLAPPACASPLQRAFVASGYVFRNAVRKFDKSDVVAPDIHATLGGNFVCETTIVAHRIRSLDVQILGMRKG